MRKGLNKFLLTSTCFIAIGMGANPIVKAETAQNNSHQMSNMPGMTPEEHQQMSNMPGMTPEEHHQMSNMPGMTPEEHQQMSNMPGMTPEEHQQMSNMPGMNTGSGGHEHSHGGIETPPNRTVLGAFALINALFILIGIWNKYLRRKVA